MKKLLLLSLIISSVAISLQADDASNLPDSPASKGSAPELYPLGAPCTKHDDCFSPNIHFVCDNDVCAVMKPRMKPSTIDVK
ncbi:hypothetical protein A3F06_00555 [candidate division TM6 bacterium RIFCSPHIGHO2_12_FULL_36_22]|nr:MAG: hypothetical protein A3F06_00555 [candidate division TM6 bacterium RIFCSPHIGHO2_12_FULL_36_22]